MCLQVYTDDQVKIKDTALVGKVCPFILVFPNNAYVLRLKEYQPVIIPSVSINGFAKAILSSISINGFVKGHYPIYKYKLVCQMPLSQL